MAALVFAGAIACLINVAGLILLTVYVRRRFAAQEEALANGHRALPEPAGPESAPATPAGMNLSKRFRILRMHRQGESPPGIAAALGVAPAEVGLVIKIHQRTGL